MTIEETLVEMLVDCGMFDSDAKAVMERVKADKGNEAMSMRWRDGIEGYPEQLLAVLWLSTKRHAVEWIDDNIPLAWYRPMFADA